MIRDYDEMIDKEIIIKVIATSIESSELNNPEPATWSKSAIFMWVKS